MATLLRIALETLENQETPPGLRYVACTTLLTALDQAIDVPTGTHVACWRYLLSTDAGASRMHRHELLHPDVARDAIRVLLDPEAGESAQDLAMATLQGLNICAVTDRDIVTLTDRAVAEGRARRLVWVLEQVHELRELTPQFLHEIRDRLAASGDPYVRAASVEVGALSSEFDAVFARRMLGDTSPIVRTSVADQLAKVEGQARGTAALIIEEHFRRETHRTVLSACHYCLATLTGSVGRRPQPVEATDEDENNLPS